VTKIKTLGCVYVGMALIRCRGTSDPV